MIGSGSGKLFVFLVRVVLLGGSGSGLTVSGSDLAGCGSGLAGIGSGHNGGGVCLGVGGDSGVWC